MGDLDDRVRRLERHNRVLGGLAAVAGVMLLLVVLAGARSAREPVVRAERFEVVDRNGVSKGYFGVTPDRGVAVSIEGGKEQEGAGLGVEADGTPFFALSRRNDHATIAMGFDDQGGVIGVLDGKGRALFSAPPTAKAARRPR